MSTNEASRSGTAVPARYEPDEFLVLEIKSYSQRTGLEQLAYLEIELVSANEQIGNYEVRLYDRTGPNRTVKRACHLRNHRRSLGGVELVRGALNELNARKSQAA